MTKRGRPTKMPTAQDRAKVRELLAEKAPISDMAKLLGYSEPTFRKHFQPEILSERKLKPSAPGRKVTDDMREKVKRYIGCKMPARQVAYALGYESDDDFTAFKADFQREIEVGAAVYRAKVLDQLNIQMVAGTLGATNKLEALTQFDEPGESGAAVGKKAAARADAEAGVAAGGKFAPRTAPRLVAVNGGPIDADD
jgi:AraC-like DNA-binding protein